MKIKTYEDACVALNRNPALPDVSMLAEKHQKAITAHIKLVTIAEALNEGWEPDWSNYNERKYYPWFEMEKTGVGFSFFVFDYRGTHSIVGSRLCYKSREIAEYAGTQFVELYRDSYVIQKQ